MLKGSYHIFDRHVLQRKRPTLIGKFFGIVRIFPEELCLTKSLYPPSDSPCFKF